MNNAIKKNKMNEIIELHKEDTAVSKCTFEISVRFQQNSTWQGQILWAEKNMKQNFRSVLEMLRLMDEALADGKSKSVEWED
ncbi:MAG: hypothetical protein FWC75_02815 [Oscillospiraceae bacterium]|nr:hypothetical protein [Oscillospiraceae bacterium]